MKKKSVNFIILAFVLSIFGCSKDAAIEDYSGGQKVKYIQSATSISYYVSPNGNDMNNGTSTSTPWKTIARVNQQASFYPGDVIYFEAGATYNGQLAPKGSGVNGDPIRVTKYGINIYYPCINANGASGAAISLNNQKYWEFQYLEVKNPAINEEERHGFKIQFNDFGTGEHIYILDCNIHDVSGVYTGEARHQGTGIFFYCSGSTTPTKVNDVKIENCKIWTIKKTGILFWSDWNKGSGLTYTPSTNVNIKNNTLTNIAGDGMLINTCDGAKLQYNIINGANNNATVPSAGMWPHMSDNVIMEYNEVYNVAFGSGDGQAFDFDIKSRWCYTQYNYSHDNGGGFHLICSDGNVGKTESSVIRFNISQNDQKNVFYFAGKTDNVYIYNNTIYVKSLLNTKMYHYSYWNGWSNNTYSYNNIFYNLGSGGYDFGSSTNNNFMYNCFYGNHPSNEPPDTYKVTGDPKFVSPGSGTNGWGTVTGYKLKSGSSCFKNGMYDPNSGGKDYWGNSVGTSPSRGFYNGTAF